MNNKGFTLIELIATIALIAVIAMISFVSINAVINENKNEQCRNLLSSIEVATKEYVSDNRYKSLNLDDFNASYLVGYLTMPIIDPYTKGEINPNDIGIIITLNDDYTVSKVDITGIDCK